MHRLRVTSLLNFALISIFLRLSNSVVAAATADNLAYVNKCKIFSQRKLPLERERERERARSCKFVIKCFVSV